MTGPGAGRRIAEVVVRGRVQGVFFRDSCRAQAQDAGVAGWVTNQPDGTVRAHFEGDEDAVQRLLDWVGEGPRRADVDGVETVEASDEGLSGFEVR